jgi:shikimate dehydrogenase
MKFGLLGHQIAYSISPVIHDLINPNSMDYEIIDIAPDDIKKLLHKRVEDFSGFNVTIPHKQSIMDLCQSVDRMAEKIGAVNTVDIRNGVWKGYNTDYLGFLSTIKEEIKNYLSFHPVIVGYGGVARAVIFALEKLGFKAVSVQGGESKKERDDFIEELNSSLNMDVFDLLPEIPRLWINCTPVGGAKIPDIPKDFIAFSHGDTLYDLNYSPSPTYLQKYASDMGIPNMNGLKMLVYQAIEAQKIWFANKMPPEISVNSIIHSIEHLNTVS